MKKDKVFSKKNKINDFVFDENVAGVFDDMLDRSVPFYEEMQRMTVELSLKSVIEDTCIYDLGCATGNTMIGILNKKENRNFKVIGIDSSKHMLEKAKKKLDKLGFNQDYKLIHADLNNPLTINNASVVILLLTLQFIRPLQRENLIKQIYDSCVNNGYLIIIEKILANDSFFSRLFIELYHDYKRVKGYSDLEISQKREALENVLIPYRLEENINLLRRNGFSNVENFFRWYNFAGLIAKKQEFNL